MGAIILENLVKIYHKAEIIFSEGDTGKEMYIIYSGSVGLYRDDGSRDGKLLAVVGSGDFFGEMALVDDSPRSATAIAEENDTRLLVLDKSKFTYLLRHQPDFAFVVMGKLCRQLRRANKEIVGGQKR